MVINVLHEYKMACSTKSANNCKSPCYWSYGSCKRDYTKSSSTSSSSNQGKFTTDTYLPGMSSMPSKFLSTRKPKPARMSRSPSKPKCKSNCNCATCNPYKERRDASRERERQRQLRKSPRKSHKKSPTRKRIEKACYP